MHSHVAFPFRSRQIAFEPQESAAHGSINGCSVDGFSIDDLCVVCFSVVVSSVVSFSINGFPVGLFSINGFSVDCFSIDGFSVDFLSFDTFFDVTVDISFRIHFSNGSPTQPLMHSQVAFWFMTRHSAFKPHITFVHGSSPFAAHLSPSHGLAWQEKLIPKILL